MRGAKAIAKGSGPRAVKRQTGRPDRGHLPHRAKPRDPLELDRLDVAIVRALQRDGRASFRRVARQVRASVTTVSSRVNRLWRSGVVTGFVPLLSVQRLADAGRSPHCVVCFVETDPRSPRAIGEIARELAGHPRVCYVFEVGNGSRLVTLASTDSARETSSLLGELARVEGVGAVHSEEIKRVHKERPNHPIPSKLAGPLGSGPPTASSPALDIGA